MDGGDAEAPADVCVIETAETEILRDAKPDRAAGEENQLGDAVVFGDDGGDAVAVHGEKLFLKRGTFRGKRSVIGELLAAGDELLPGSAQSRRLSFHAEIRQNDHARMKFQKAVPQCKMRCSDAPVRADGVPSGVRRHNCRRRHCSDTGSLSACR